MSKTMNRYVNFYAGPSMISVEVLTALAQEMIDYQGKGLSLLEMSHRDDAYAEVHYQVIALLRELMGIPLDYSVLLLGGGATLQFSMVPMNMLLPNGICDYVNSGMWAAKAVNEAEKFGRVNIIWDGRDVGYRTLPPAKSVQVTKKASYVHITSNETVNGMQWKEFPDTGDIPLFADMSSDILSRPVEVRDFGLIYAGAQKNLGTAGVTVVIIRNDLFTRCRAQLGSYLNYATHAKNDSLVNTPPVFAIWTMKLVLENMKKRGGVEEIALTNRKKAAALYHVIDESDSFYQCPIDPSVRSDMNVVWQMPDEEILAAFIKEAAGIGLVGLKGHRSVGGCRASLYNAMDMDGVNRLITFMQEFRGST